MFLPVKANLRHATSFPLVPRLCVRHSLCRLERLVLSDRPEVSPGRLKWVNNSCMIMHVGSESACLSLRSWLGLKVSSPRLRLHSTPRSSGGINLKRRVKFLSRRIHFLPWRRATWVGGLFPRSPRIQRTAISTSSGLAISASFIIERGPARGLLSMFLSKNRATVRLWGAHGVARGLRLRGAAGLSVGSLVGCGRLGSSFYPSTFWVVSSAAVAPSGPWVGF